MRCPRKNEIVKKYERDAQIYLNRDLKTLLKRIKRPRAQEASKKRCLHVHVGAVTIDVQMPAIPSNNDKYACAGIFFKHFGNDN